jgi:hypothetical protein
LITSAHPHVVPRGRPFGDRHAVSMVGTVTRAC